MIARRIHSAGFTLVEVLVVIAIIGVLVALLLPAVQAARESARRSQCTNHLKQMGLAVQMYHDTRGRFPTGRERIDEFGTSWAFRLLPYLEEEAIYRSHAPQHPAEAPENATAMRSPVPAFYCPSRREPAADRDFTKGHGPSPLEAAAAGGDYAANAGTAGVDYGKDENDLPLPRVDGRVAGPMFSYSRVSSRQVQDGLSKTIAVGERHIPPPPAAAPAGGIHLAQGDTAFHSSDTPDTIFASSHEGFAEGPDDPSSEKFGSEHDVVSHFLLLDGHVQALEHSLDTEALQLLTAIADGRIIPDAAL